MVILSHKATIRLRSQTEISQLRDSLSVGKETTMDLDSRVMPKTPTAFVVLMFFPRRVECPCSETVAGAWLKRSQGRGVNE